jgi:hypothetical protein
MVLKSGPWTRLHGDEPVEVVGGEHAQVLVDELVVVDGIAKLSRPRRSSHRAG